MVQFKRKPVKFESLPPFLDDNTEVWVIEATQEVFTDYEKYLSKRDFYLQPNFTCESTGHQGYTFFEAQESEFEASSVINSIFPESLRARVLAFVQFRNTARMDDLVNVVYDHFREHFTVGDRVSIELEIGRKYGIITQMQDTSRLHNIFTAQPGDDQYQSFTYHIMLEDGGEQVTKYKASELQRDRRVYSKLILKQFLRSAVSREAWNGAPWIVKEQLAKRYSINMRVPLAKTRDAVMAAKKAANAVSLANYNNVHHYDPNAHERQNISIDPQGMHRQLPQPGQGQATFVNYAANGHRPYPPNQPPPTMAYAEPPRLAMPSTSGGLPPPAFWPPPHPTMIPPQLAHVAQNFQQTGHVAPHGLPINAPFPAGFMQYQALAPTNLPQQPSAVAAKPFETIKYPMEDLRIRSPRVNIERPPLKCFSDDVFDGGEAPETSTGILMKSMGPLLCAWETLNVHDTIYTLDSFTFDDFVDAMRFSSEEDECELLVEAHCAILKQIVNENGKLLAPLPRIEESDESENGESSKTTSPEREPTPPVRTTRSSLRKSEVSVIVKPRTPTPEPPKQLHKAAEFLADFDWLAECKIRNFRDGGWQSILVGLLYTLSFNPLQKEACDQILAELVPSDEEPSEASIARRYTALDVNLRIIALDTALRLTIATEAFRDQLASAGLEMTRLRKEKIEFQKKRKELADELFKLDNERKIQLPLNMPASPTDIKENGDTPMGGTDELKDESDAESLSEEPPKKGNRKLRHTKHNKRKREADAVKKEKAKKAKQEAAKTKQQQEWEKLLLDIEDKKEELRDCEANIAELDDDLRETLVSRSKLIGKDRFLNKYYWFEHNGMPFGGVPNSSTAEYGYANGRLWVQGPDEYEIQPNLEEPALSQDMHELGYTVPQRKEREEGSTHLSKSVEWGYYDDPDDLDKLIAWLDERGVRERVLRKELQAFRDRIAEYMEKMQNHLSEVEKNKTDEEEGATRISTRGKTYVEKDVSKDRCLQWTNSIMRGDYGYNHSEEYEPPRRAKKGTAKVLKGKGRK